MPGDNFEPINDPPPIDRTREMAKAIFILIRKKRHKRGFFEPQFSEILKNCKTDPKKIAYGKDTPHLEDWPLVEEYTIKCGVTREEIVEIYRMKPERLGSHIEFRSFIDILDHETLSIKETMNDFKGRYFYFAPSPDLDGFVAGICEFSTAMVEGRLPVFRLYRDKVGGEYHYVGCYFRAGNLLFLLGSRKGMADARLYVFNIGMIEDRIFLSGAAAGVWHKKNAPFASNCCLVKCGDDVPIEVDRNYSLDELEAIDSRVHRYFVHRHCAFINSPHENGI